MITFSDPILQKLYLTVEKTLGQIPDTTPAPEEKYFENLIESIVSQQLSVKVADIIFARLKAAGGDFSPAAILALEHETLRSVGLSNAKANYVKNIAEAWNNGLVKPSELTTMNNEDVIAHLVQIKGVGRWTAEMFLMFTLARPDVFSVGDFGLRKAISLAYNIPMTEKPPVFSAIAEQWHPHRTLASRILWRSLDLPTDT